MAKPEKAKVVEQLKEKISRAKAVYLTDYTGLKVLDLTQMRREFQKNGAEFKVAKNTLIRRALEGTDFQSLSEHLTGQSGLVFGYDDPTVPARVLQDYFKRLEKPKVKLFYLEGKHFTGADLLKIATLPSKEVLLARVVGQIQAPLASLVYTLNGMLASLVTTVDNIREKKERETAAA